MAAINSSATPLPPSNPSACPIYQHRTLDHLYLVWPKEKDQALVAICNVAQRCLWKRPVSLAELEIPSAENISLLLERAIAKKVIPQKYALPQTQATNEPLKRMIREVRAQIPAGNPFLKEFFTCPGTQVILEDPVLQSCGHTVSREIAEKWKGGNECVLRCKKSNAGFPNLLVRQVIEHFQSKDPIPTLAQFKNQNQKLAERNLETARLYVQEGEYQEALDSYSKAFQFTKDLNAYAEVPKLLERMEQPEKAVLAYLYLAQYQMEDGKTSEAMQMVEQCKRLKDDSVPIHTLWVKLALEVKHDSKTISMAIEESAKLLSSESNEAVVDFYKQLLIQDPTQWHLYTSLAGLLKEPAEQAHVFLTGACQAMKCQQQDIATGFCDEAKRLSPDPLIDQLVYAELSQKQTGKNLSEELNILAAQIEERFQSPAIPQGAFGPEEWKFYWEKDVQDVPPLPPNIEETLNGDILVLVPKRMSLNKLEQLVQNPKNGGHKTKYDFFGDSSRAAHGDTAAASSYWVALRPTVFEGSRNKTFAEQQALVAAYNQQHGTDYQIPNALDAAVVNFVEYVRSKKCLYGREPVTYTRCLETTDGYHLVVGGGGWPCRPLRPRPLLRLRERRCWGPAEVIRPLTLGYLALSGFFSCSGNVNDLQCRL